LFIEKPNGIDLQESVTLTKFEDKQNAMESQVQEITELPSNLINFFHVCEG
jgi:ATP-dependent RNA helicase DDX55/SPB4